jgi:ElaB/YqjD/DUF883 family membrane-anchored ribosome-binding protein
MQTAPHKSNHSSSTNGLGPAVDKVAAGVHDAVDAVAEAATAAAKAVDKKGEQLKAVQRRYVDECRERVRDNPLQSLGVALAVGFLISKLLRLR